MNTNQIKDRKYRRSKLILVLLFLIIIAFTSVHTIFTFEAAKTRWATVFIQADTKVDPSFEKERYQLIKQKALLKSRLKMATKDSIGLTIDLVDSIMQIELKGVVLMSSRIKNFSYSKILGRLQGVSYLNLFETPAEVKRYDASIVKNQLKVKVIPEHSTKEQEYIQEIPDTTINKFISWSFVLDRGLVLNVQGIDPSSKLDFNLGKGSVLSFRFRSMLESAWSIIRFQKPVYRPEIRISISAKEARAMFRALPAHASVSIRI